MMQTLELPGAKLHYHQVGQGPILILIPGANGTGDIFLPLAERLKEQFTVIAIDRRNYGKSKLTKPLPQEAKDSNSEYRVKRDAQDVAALAQQLSDDPVYVLGSSSGSIVAMHLLKEHSDIVKEIAFHEPPINTFLPDSKYWKDKNDEIVNLAITEGLEPAMQLFGETLNIAPLDAQSMSQPVTENDEEQKEQYESMMFWVEYEIRQYTHSNIKLSDLTQYKDKIVLFNGTDSKGSFPQDVNFYINEQTNIELLDIPGGHLGYVQKPDGFAETLLKTWS